MRRAAFVLVSWFLLGTCACSLFGSSNAKSRSARPGAAPRARAVSAKAATHPGALSVDRIVVRWYAPETGGVDKPQFIHARELAFEARLEALADPDPDGAIYRDRHVRAALDRHIAEVLLASLPCQPDPTPQEIASRAEGAWAMLEQRVSGHDKVLDPMASGRDRLLNAARAEGLGLEEINAMLRRQARASLYLDRMIAPMLEPTTDELMILHRSGSTPFSARPFKEVKDRVKRWYVSGKLSQALDKYFQNARQRVTILVVRKPQ